jgi:hypothetical protein
VDLTALIALAAALGWASGLRLYAVVFLTGVSGLLGWVDLPAGLQLLQHPAVLAVAGLGMVSEFVADKIPLFDSVWDTVHTFIRIPAGALLAAGVFGGDGALWSLLAALLGGTLAATAHTAKATTRAAVNGSPEPFSNWGLSLAGDAYVPALLWLAWQSPGWFFGVLGATVLVALGLIVVLWTVLRGLLAKFRVLPSVPAVR